MFSTRFGVRLVGLAVLLLALVHASAAEQDRPTKQRLAIVGRWDMTVQTPDGNYPSWLEVRRSGYTTLVGSFVGQFGSARPIGRVEFENGRLRFSVPPQWEQRKDDLSF